MGVETGVSTDTPVPNAMANAGECYCSLDLGEERPRTPMAIIPVKIHAKFSNKTIIMYTFLDNGSSATFCTESLMRKLGVDSTKVKISLSTLEKKNSPVDSYLIWDLVVSDLDENHFVHLPTLYTRPDIPFSKNDIPTQEDVDQWPHLDGLFIPQVDAEIGLLKHLIQSKLSTAKMVDRMLQEVRILFYPSWEKWLANVPKLLSFSICRSVLPEAFSPVVSSQLHHFSDASEAAYGSVSYLRLVNEEGRVHCSFLFQLAPLKSVSIPRLELSAAS